MYALNRCARFLACLAVVGMITAPVCAAAPRTKKPNQPKVFDVKLTGREVLGQVVNSAGKPAGDSDVIFVSGRKTVGLVKTDGAGRFRLPLEKPGVYRVAVADRAVTIRAWRAEVAPPAAKDSLLCVIQDTVRGQCGGCGSVDACGCGPAACAPAACGPCGGGFAGFGGGGTGLMSVLSNPAVIGLGVAAAIALPIALDDDDDDDAGSGGAGEPTS